MILIYYSVELHILLGVFNRLTGDRNRCMLVVLTKNFTALSMTKHYKF